MPKNLAKVQKKIRQKRGSNANSLHENSRDAQTLRRAGAREDRLARISTARAKLNRPHLQRVAFFQQAARESKGPFTIESVRSLIQTYLHRDDEELSKSKRERRPGRPSSTREDLLKQKIETEKNEFKIGFNTPDMEDGKNVEALLRWTGEWTSLSNIKFIKDVPGQEEVELTRQFGNESIKVIFTIADLKESDSDTDADRYDYPIYDEGDSDDEGSGDEDSRPQLRGVVKARGSPVNVAPKGKAAPADHPELAGEEEADSLHRGPPNFPARANVIIDKAGQGTLRIETVVEDGVVAIDNVHYLPSAELADVKNAEKDWQRIAMYKGPPFGILDEDLQVLFERYIDERGVNTALALFIPDYIDFKEQREYVSWLSNLKNFIEA
ncbi:MAG: hypothetical protein M1839_000170 [Geoglossum umbratile]|nr:MAG: hypothetical protein M1839_000170 [Geoglossum umbratile]